METNHSMIHTKRALHTIHTSWCGSSGVCLLVLPVLLVFLTACGPRLDSKDWKKRQAAVEKLTDQATLAKVAVGDEDWYVRKAAVMKLSDQTALAKVACEDKDPNIRIAAVEKLTDQAALARIASEDRDLAIRKAAVAKLTDQAALVRVACEDKDLDIRKTAVAKLTDQTLLAKVAVEGADGRVCLAAIEKLTDQGMLAKVAAEGKDWQVRLAAVEKLTDQVALTKFAIEGDGVVRLAAVEKLTDQATLAKAALEDNTPFHSVHRAAIAKLTDQSALAMVALEDWSEHARHAAAEKLTDPALLARVGGKKADMVSYARAIAALSESDPAIKRLSGELLHPARDTRNAIARIKLALQEPRIKSRIPGNVFKVEINEIRESYFRIGGGSGGDKLGERVHFELNQAGTILASGSWRTRFTEKVRSLEFWSADIELKEFFEELFRLPVFTQEDLIELSRSEIPELRLVAAANLADNSLLALTNRYADVREAAVVKLSDQKLLGKIVVEDKDTSVRGAAVKKLLDQTLLTKVAVEDKDWQVREVAVAKLIDQKLLSEIAVEDKGEWVRRAAKARIKELASKK